MSRIRLIILLMLTASGTFADELLVPAATQIPILQKIWTLDRTFPRRRGVRVAVLYQQKYRRSARVMEDVLQATAGAPSMEWMPVALIDGRSIAEQIPADIDVVYVTPLRSVNIEAITRETRARDVRSVTPVAEYVAEGVGLGIVVESDRPRIVINLEAAEAEGAEYSSQLLKLARLISKDSHDPAP